ncbi:hypothetical protein R1T16_05660 [Flavobacterium sp. DG1-102-2]|uniref:hypothetical protein n=1 Tax=Flavobacterium sp. DG1-102-2 TaxID=3081663 RepID=UPI0029490B31|nr:hypothetical protein [Flavobacterium sp. DG1-102-2]MDV6167902.1 hypothetical protein [Flavobacterium sp. DG1-102-2]
MKKTEYKVFLNPDNFWVGKQTDVDKIIITDESKKVVKSKTYELAESNRPSVVTVYDDIGEFQEDKTFSERKLKF